MISLEPLEERVILRLGICNPRVTQVDLTGAQFMEEWEVHLRVLKRAIMERGLPLTLFYHVGASSPMTGLRSAISPSTTRSLFLNRDAGRLFDESPDRFPAGTYLTMYCDTLVDEQAATPSPSTSHACSIMHRSMGMLSLATILASIWPKLLISEKRDAT